MKKSILLIQVVILFLALADVYSQWIPQTSGTTWNLRGVSFINANTGTVVGVSGTILKTTNGGINWFSQSVDSAIHLNGVDFFDANTGIAVGWMSDSAAILKTTNGGTNWSLRALVKEKDKLIIRIDSLIRAIVVGDSGTILKTTNRGTNWIIQTSGTINNLYGASFTDVNTGTVVGQNGTILKTTNGGIDWLYIQVILDQPPPFQFIVYIDANTATVVGDSGTILSTTNGGTNWFLQTSGTTRHLYDVSFTDTDTGTVIGDHGTILRTTNGGVFVKQISSEIPERFSLYQNYPNPFNPFTNIGFDLNKTLHVKLIIYDVLGRQITTLVNEKLSAGSYEVVWPAPTGNASDYTSGVYFYKLITEEFTDTKKMVLLK